MPGAVSSISSKFPKFPKRLERLERFAGVRVDWTESLGGLESGESAQCCVIVILCNGWNTGYTFDLMGPVAGEENGSSGGSAKAMNMNMNTNGADKGPGAFAPLPSLPRRNTSSKPASATKPRGKASLFHIRGDDDSNSDSDSNNNDDDDDARLGLDAFNYTTNLPAAPPPNLPARGLPALKLNPNTSFPALQLRLNTDEKPPLVMRPRNHYSPFKNNSLSNINSLNTSTPSFNNANLSGGAVPFPSSSPLSPQPPSQHIAFTSTPPAASTPSTAPQQSHPGAPAARPPLRPAVARTSSTPIFLSNGKPLKSSLKSSLPFAVNHPHTLSLSLSASASSAAAASSSASLSAPHQSSSLKSSSSSPNVAAATAKTAYPKESVIPMIPSNYTRAVLGIYARGRSASAASAASTPGAAANALGAGSVESVQRAVSEGAGHQQELSAESVSTSATTSSPPTPTTEHPQLQLQPHLRSLSLSALHPYFARASEHYDMGMGVGVGVDDLEHLRDGLGLGELEELESLETLESLMTPKNVHFAENDGLASVRVFNRSGRPKSLLRGGRRHAHAEHANANTNTHSDTNTNTNANMNNGDGDRDGGNGSDGRRDNDRANAEGEGEGVLSGGETETETEGESSTGYSSSAYGSSGYGYRASGYGASGWWGSGSARSTGGTGRRAWGWGDRQGGNGQGQGQGQGGEYPFPRVDAPSGQSSANAASASGLSTIQPPQSQSSQSQSSAQMQTQTTQTTANSGSNSGYAYTIDASASSPIPTPDPNPAGNVFIESIVLDEGGGAGKGKVNAGGNREGNGGGNGGEGPVLSGTVLVRNVTFEKAVFVRFTLDGWDTTSEVAARWVCGATPGDNASANRNSALLGTLLARSPHSSWDRFAFRISLLAYSTSLHARSLVLVARYLTGGGVGGGEWWDNNGGADYRVAFTKVKEASKEAKEGEDEARGMHGMQGMQGTEAKAKASGVRGSGSPWLGPLNVPRRVVVSAPVLRVACCSCAVAIPGDAPRLELRLRISSSTGDCDGDGDGDGVLDVVADVYDRFVVHVHAVRYPDGNWCQRTSTAATPAQALPAEEKRQAPTPPDTPPRTASPLPYTSNQAAASPSSPSSSYLSSSPRSGITISRTSPPTTPSKSTQLNESGKGVNGGGQGQGQGMSGGVSAIPFPMKRSPVPSPAGSRTGSPAPSPTLTSSPSLNPSLNPMGTGGMGMGMGIPTPKPSPSSSLANMSDLSSLTHGNGMGGVGLSSSPPFSTMGMGSYWPWAGPPSTARPPLSRSTASSNNNSSNSATGLSPRSTMKTAPAKLGGLSPVSSSLASSLASYPQLQMRVNTSPGLGAGLGVGAGTGTASDDEEEEEELVTPNDMGLHTAPRATGVGRSSSPPNEDTFSLSHSSGDEGLATPKPSHSALSSLSALSALSPSSPFPPTTTTTTTTGTGTPPTSPSSPSALAAANENGDIRGGLSRISGGGSDDELYKAFVRQWCFAAGPSAVVG
ncbi:carbohydrate-binding module family 21 protein [Pleurotus ostreatus PC15]|uniref:Carbohydrate-binding module family 21 protein n=1 Tax=Pleurotus ostreatus (strain PC15) TaxID=1137138 RepID=A0A067P6I9_PLEO1|nr:carbohydrate-binding module family 21 protein [Pleurotus ostreatus PC15]